MTKNEYLLQKLQEECAEVIKASAKYALFGAESKNPLDPDSKTNRQQLADEIVDVMATVEMIGALDMLTALTPKECGQAIQDKQTKIEYYMEISREIGTLEKEPPVEQVAAKQVEARD